MRFFPFALTVLLAACGAPSNKPEPAPLPKPQRKDVVRVQWENSIGSKTDFRFAPQANSQSLAVAGGNNALALLDLQSGRERWSIKLKKPLAGGVGLDDAHLVVGTLAGELLAYDLQGKQLWSSRLSTELISAPVVAGGLVLARTNDGRLTAFGAADGKQVWVYQRPMPALVLRNFSAPVVDHDVIYLGMAGGKLVALTLADGRQLWESTVATPRGASELERIADIVSAPVVEGNQVCAAAFQGRVACMNIRDGAVMWARDLSSWSGLALDKQNVYVTDDRGYVNALERTTGRSMWRQEQLFAREVSAPAVAGPYVVVGDFEGYVHYLDPNDGKLLAQTDTDGGRIAIAPRVIGKNLLVQTLRGGLSVLAASDVASGK